MPRAGLRRHRIAVLGMLTVASVSCAGGGGLRSDDRAAIRQLDSVYVAAWLEDDSAAVLSTLAPDAVLMPAGQRPLADREAIRDFWWPNDGSRTRITSYTSVIDEIAGDRSLAYFRSTGELSFTYTKDSVSSEVTSRNMTLTIVTRAKDGRWHIARRMWGPLTP